jgi:hypothetical protein
MPYSTKEMLKDSKGNYIPQWFDPVADDFKPIETAMPVQLTGSKVKVTEIIADSSVSIGAGLTGLVTIVPTAGYKARIINAMFEAPQIAGATTGTQEIDIYQGQEHVRNSVGMINCAFGGGITYRSGKMATGGAFSEPPTGPELQSNLWHTEFTADTPLKIRYRNATDKAQSGTRIYRLVVVEEAIS